jgi:hypothetical protein
MSVIFAILIMPLLFKYPFDYEISVNNVNIRVVRKLQFSQAKHGLTNFRLKRFGRQPIRLANKSVIKLTPILNAAVNDYVTHEFLQPAIILYSLYFYIAITSFIAPIDNISITASNILGCILSICFYLLIDSVPNTNWMFYSIIKPDFNFQTQKAFIFLMCLFILPIITMIYFIIHHDIKYILFYSQWGLIPRPLGRFELVTPNKKW